jgi:hypothetical protein
MYLSRWRAGLAEGSTLLGFLEGLRDVSTRWVVSHDYEHWKDEIAWMSLYFSVAVWSSLALGSFPLLQDRLLQYRVGAGGASVAGRHRGSPVARPRGLAPASKSVR